VLAKANTQFSRAIHTEHKASLDKLIACVSKTNLVSTKIFSHQDLSEITKSKRFSRALQEDGKLWKNITCTQNSTVRRIERSRHESDTRNGDKQIPLLVA